MCGAKHSTDIADLSFRQMVGEHSVCAEGGPARASGAYGRENAEMSNHKDNEKLSPRKSKVSVALAINHGLGGPKAMVKTAADGQLVNIPALPTFSNEGTEDTRSRALMVWHRCFKTGYRANLCICL